MISLHWKTNILTNTQVLGWLSLQWRRNYRHSEYIYIYISAGPNSWQQVCNRLNPEKTGRTCEGADFTWLSSKVSRTLLGPCWHVPCGSIWQFVGLDGRHKGRQAFIHILHMHLDHEYLTTTWYIIVVYNSMHLLRFHETRELEATFISFRCVVPTTHFPTGSQRPHIKLDPIKLSSTCIRGVRL